MSVLAENAARMARPSEQPAPGQPVPAGPAAVVEPVHDEPDMPTADADDVPVHVAWARVMTGVREIRKSEKYSAAGTNYNFRGVDTVVNAFAPVLRKHGVLVLPVQVDASYRDFKNNNNKIQRECTVTVTWMVMGPRGDTLPSTLQSAGEALDSADKGTAKAQSVALRVLLLTAAMVPTDSPDPDSQYVERGEAAVRPAGSYVEEITDSRTSPGRLRQIHFELKSTGQLGAMVMNETGGDERIGDMVVRIGKERTGGSQ